MGKHTIHAIVIVLLGIGITYAAKQRFDVPQPVQVQPNSATVTVQWKPETLQPEIEVVKEPEMPAINEKNIKSYQEAVSLSAKLNKKVLLFFSSTTCPHCTHMKKVTLEDRSVKKALEPYIFYEVDTDKEKSIAIKYNIRGIPAYRIIDKAEKVYAAGEGDKRPLVFEQWLIAAGTERIVVPSRQKSADLAYN